MLLSICDPADPRLDDIRDLKHSDKEKNLVFAEGPLVAETSRPRCMSYPATSPMISRVIS